MYGDKTREQEFREGFARDGKRLDMGKSCVRFQRIDQLSLATIEKTIAGVPPETLMAMHDSVHNPEARAKRSAVRAKTAAAKKKPTARKPVAKAKPVARKKPVSRKKSGARSARR